MVFFLSLFSLFFFWLVLFGRGLFVCLFDGVFFGFLLPNTFLRCFRLTGDLAGDAQYLTGFVSDSHMTEN